MNYSLENIADEILSVVIKWSIPLILTTFFGIFIKKPIQRMMSDMREKKEAPFKEIRDMLIEQNQEIIKRGEEIRMQGDVIAKQGEMMERQSAMLERQDESITKQGKMILEIREWQDEKDIFEAKSLESDLATLDDRICWYVGQCLQKGYTTSEDRRRLSRLHEAYKALGGNHGEDREYARALALPTEEQFFSKQHGG